MRRTKKSPEAEKRRQLAAKKRRDTLLAEGKCICGEPLALKRPKCAGCLEIQRIKAEAKKSAGGAP